MYTSTDRPSPQHPLFERFPIVSRNVEKDLGTFDNAATLKLAPSQSPYSWKLLRRHSARMRRRFSSASFLVDMSVWFAKRCYTHQKFSTPGLNASAAQVLEYEPRDKGDEPLLRRFLRTKVQQRKCVYRNQHDNQMPSWKR